MAIAALVLWVLTAAAGLGLLMAGAAAKRAAAPQAAPVPAPPVRVPAAGPPGPPPIPRVKVHATPGEHPLLEFSHPLLGLIGLGFWFVYVGTRHAPLAWASFGVLVAAIGAGLSWLAATRSPPGAVTARPGPASRSGWSSCTGSPPAPRSCWPC